MSGHNNQSLPEISVEPGQIRRFLNLLASPPAVCEIRVLGYALNGNKPATMAGYFNSTDLATATEQLATMLGRPGAKAMGCYATLNPVNAALLARSCNRLMRVTDGSLARDSDVVRRRWLLIDLDPVRPSGISSSNAEHAAARDRADEIRRELKKVGFPNPFLGDSGNGAHLGYRIDLPNDPSSHELVKRVLEAIDFRFGDAFVDVDRCVHNAARISKIYGTLACKGESIPERPHRLANLLEEPSETDPVSSEVLREITSWLPESSRSRSVQGLTQSPSGGLAEVLDRPELETRGPKDWRGHKLWRIHCPWRPEDGNSAYILQQSGGTISAACWHATCPGSKKNGDHWADLRLQLGLADERSEPHDSGQTARAIQDLREIPCVWLLEQNVEWLVPDMIPLRTVNLIASESGTGKTWLAYHLAGSVAHGKEIIGRQVPKLKVLYLDGENPLAVVKHRLFDLGIDQTADLTVWGGWVDSMPPGPSSPIVMKFAREHQGLIIYDSLVEFHTGSEQSSTETRAFMRLFRRLANLGATVVILHHTGKAPTAQQYRGSTDIKAAVDVAYVLKRTDSQPQGLGVLNMVCFKNRLAPECHFGLQFQKGRGFVETTLEPSMLVEGTEEFLNRILNERPGMNQKEILKRASDAGMVKQQVLHSLHSGVWRITSGSKNETRYFPPIDDSGDERIDPEDH